jgi:fructose-1,6-bisphosphatase I
MNWFFLDSEAFRAAHEGRLRLLYEARLRASRRTGDNRTRPILDLVKTIHQRVPLIMGSINKVQRIDSRHSVEASR